MQCNQTLSFVGTFNSIDFFCIELRQVNILYKSILVKHIYMCVYVYICLTLVVLFMCIFCMCVCVVYDLQNIYYIVEITESQNSCPVSHSAFLCRRRRRRRHRHGVVPNRWANAAPIYVVHLQIQWTEAVKIGTCDLLHFSFCLCAWLTI